MKRSVKKMLWVSLGLLSALAIASWYFFPIYTYKFNYQNDQLIMKYLVLKPTHIDNLATPPQEWSTVQIGGISLKVPLYRFSKVEGTDTSLRFYSKSELLSIGDLAPTTELMDVIKKEKLKYPLLSFQQRMAALESLPNDVALFNSRQHNMEGLTNQMCKFLSVTVGGISEIETYNPNKLKAIAVISKKREKSGYSANVEIYSQNERAFFTMALLKYRDKEVLKDDLRKLLGGISIPDQPNDLESAKKDINIFVSKHGRSQPAPRPAQEAGRSGF